MTGLNLSSCFTPPSLPPSVASSSETATSSPPTPTPSTVDTDAFHTAPGLSRQLSEALQRARQRDASLTRDELRAHTLEALSEIWPSDYQKFSGKDDGEIPETDDPHIRARARQATAFENGASTNPFKGLPAELLTTISYDDSGTFTLNERRAARAEFDQQRHEWELNVIVDAHEEYDATGQLTRYHGQELEYYNSLPLIEQARWPEHHEQRLVDTITQMINSSTPSCHPSLHGVLSRWKNTQFKILQRPEVALDEEPDNATHASEDCEKPLLVALFERE